MDSAWHYLAVIVVGFAAAFLNTVGGGGSLFSVPLLTFLGLPITVANATSRVAILFQHVFASAGFRSKGVTLPWPYGLYLGLASLAGGFVGALLASRLSDAAFRQFFVAVMLLSVILILWNPFRTAGEERLRGPHQRLGAFLFFFIGVYGGLVQAGVGFLTIAVLSLVNNFGLVKSNYIKVFSAILYTGVSVAVFAWQQQIDWATGGVLTLGHAAGGWVASRWSVDAGDVWIRRLLVVGVVAMAAVLWLS